MANVFDVASYILQEKGPMAHMKLQKLCYFAQAWHFKWDNQLLFDDRIEAWANGPIVPKLYEKYRGVFHIAKGPNGHPENITIQEIETIKAVLDAYGDLTAHELSELSHNEIPWQKARIGLFSHERSNREIKFNYEN